MSSIRQRLQIASLECRISSPLFIFIFRFFPQQLIWMKIQQGEKAIHIAPAKVCICIFCYFINYALFFWALATIMRLCKLQFPLSVSVEPTMQVLQSKVFVEMSHQDESSKSTIYLFTRYLKTYAITLIRLSKYLAIFGRWTQSGASIACCKCAFVLRACMFVFFFEVFLKIKQIIFCRHVFKHKTFL